MPFDKLPRADELIDLFGLQRHPEGGLFKESYRSAGHIDEGGRNFSTAIYFLLRAGEKSHLHRIASDEIWHFYLGGPMTLVQIAPDGTVTEVVLGQDVLKGQRLQHVVPAGHWFGGYAHQDAGYTLTGCTVAPGFAFDDFELGDRSELLRTFPHAETLIRDLTGG